MVTLTIDFEIGLLQYYEGISFYDAFKFALMGSYTNIYTLLNCCY